MHIKETQVGTADGSVMHISVDNILTNMQAETGLDKKKTFEETVFEEVVHAGISQMVSGMDAVSRQRLVRELEDMLGVDSAVVQRARSKQASERAKRLADGKSETEADKIAADEITEMISAIAANPNLDPTLGKMKPWFNSLFSASDARFTISSDSSAANRS